MTISDIDWALSLGGLVAGVMVGLTGMGGAALVTPMLVLIFGISPAAAVSSDVVASAIRGEIETSLRPLSHRIWFSSSDPEPRARISRLLRDALLRIDLHPRR